MRVKRLCLLRLYNDSKELSDQCDLPFHITFCHIPHLSLPDHVHDLESAAQVRQAVSKEKKPIPGFVKRLMNRWSCSIMVSGLSNSPRGGAKEEISL